LSSSVDWDLCFSNAPAYGNIVLEAAPLITAIWAVGQLNQAGSSFSAHGVVTRCMEFPTIKMNFEQQNAMALTILLRL
jgi:hypothetical protein